MRQRQPKVDIAVITGPPPALIQAVEGMEADFALGPYPGGEGFDFQELFREQAVLILPKNHSLHVSERPTLEEIATLPLVAFSRDPLDLLHFVGAGMNPAPGGREMRIVVRVQNAPLAVSYVEAGLGGAVVSRHVLTPEQERALDVRCLAGDAGASAFGSLRLRGRFLSPQARAFLDLVHEEHSDGATTAWRAPN